MKKLALGLTVSVLFFSGSVSGAETGAANNDYLVPLAANTLCPQKAVETGASGEVALHYDAAKQELSYEFRVENLEDVRMAHLHLGADDKKGFRVAWLYPADGSGPLLAPGTSDGILARGTLRDQDLVGPLAGKSLQDLALNLQTGRFFIDVHTTAYPTGELSGNLNPAAAK